MSTSNSFRDAVHPDHKAEYMRLLFDMIGKTFQIWSPHLSGTEERVCDDEDSAESVLAYLLGIENVLIWKPEVGRALTQIRSDLRLG
jgi:hypothetical protein